MKKEYKSVFVISAMAILTGVCFLMPVGAKAAIWQTEGVPEAPSGYTSTNYCDYHRDNYGDCGPYIYTVSDIDQAYIGHFAASFQGTAGWIGPGLVAVTSCLSNNQALYSTGSSCWLLYNVELRNSAGSISTTDGTRTIGNDPNPTFRYWVTNIYVNEAIVWGISNWAEGRHVYGTLNTGESTVNVGESFAVSWQSDWSDYEGGLILSWEGAVGRNGSTSGSISVDKSGALLFTGLSPGVGYIDLDNLCGPYGQADSGVRPLCLERRRVQVNVVASFVNLNFYVKNQIGQPISGALITINQDFGNGTTRTTDSNGFANFGVYTNRSIGYSISATSCNNMSGVANVGTSDKTVNETLSCSIGCSGSSTQSCTVSNACGTSSGTQTRTCDTSTGNWNSWSACSAVPPYIPPNYGSSCTSAANACGQTSTGTISCDGSCSATPPPLSSCPATSVSISASPTSVSWNSSSTITWSPQNATSCTASGDWNGSKSPSGGTESTGNLTQVRRYTYTLECTGLNGTDTKSATVDVAAPVPVVGPGNPTYSVPNYCESGPGGYIAWAYSDPAGSPQTAYEIQITNTGNFNNPIYNSTDYFGSRIPSSSRVHSIPTGVLDWNTTYKARVRVWNSYGSPSEWSGDTNSWKTPSYAYPNVIPPYQFTLLPTHPQQNKVVQFTDHTVFGGGNENSRQWSWIFGDGATSTQQNPTHTYSIIGNFTVIETVTDAANQTCSYSQSINIQLPVPVIKEVAPK